MPITIFYTFLCGPLWFTLPEQKRKIKFRLNLRSYRWIQKSHLKNLQCYQIIGKSKHKTNFFSGKVAIGKKEYFTEKPLHKIEFLLNIGQILSNNSKSKSTIWKAFAIKQTRLSWIWTCRRRIRKSISQSETK